MKFLLRPQGWPANLLLALLTLCLSSPGRAQRPISFDYLVIDPAGPRDPWGKTVGDLNADGAPDLIVGGFVSGGLIWYENPSWSPHVISGLTGFRTDHETGDVDRDGLLDVVSLGTDSAGRPWLGWFKNPGPGTEWSPSTIDTNLLHDLEVADLNGDGRIDVIGRNQEAFKPGNGDTLFVYTQVTPSTWSKFMILCANGEGLKVADVNRDARPDIVVNGWWFENRGIDTVWVAHNYTSTYTYRSVAVDVADIDDDGLADIILSPSEPAGDTYRISWLKAPTDPAQTEWIEHVIEDGVEAVHHSIGAADFDNDGSMDVVCAKMNSGTTLPEVKLFLNGGQGQIWTKQVVATTGSHSMRIVDIDNNGSKDLFGANWRGVTSELWLNQPDTLAFSIRVSEEGGAAQVLRFGLGRYASDSLDAVLGEQELQGVPVPGQFDARFVGTDIGLNLGKGTHRDFRRGDSATVGTRTYELSCQAGVGAKIAFAVDLPPQVLLHLRSLPPGAGIDTQLTGRTEFIASSPGAPLRILMTATYVLSKPPPPAQRFPDQGALEVEPDPTLLWDPVEYCSHYHVQVGLQGLPGDVLVIDSLVTESSLQLPLLDSLATYWWQVAGVNPAGEGEFSPVREFQTKEFVADPRTLGLWRLNESEGGTAFDLTLNANDGTAIGTSAVEARYGYGREFDGIGDYVDLPESPLLLQPGRKLTTEAWVFMPAFPAAGTRATIVSTGNQKDYELSIGEDGRVQGQMYTSSGSDSVTGSVALPLNTWAHVAMTYDGSRVRLFVNGVLDASRTRFSTIGGSPQPDDILVGASMSGGTRTDFFRGMLDEVRILKIARLPQDFTLQLPPAGLAATPGPQQIILTWQNGGGGAPLMRYRVYRGMDSSSTTLVDSSEVPSYTDTAVAPFQEHFYRVTAVDSSGFEGMPATAVRAASLLGLPDLLSPAAGVSGVPVSPALTWMSVQAAEMYQVQVFADSGLEQGTADTTVADTTLVVSNVLERGRRHFWRVRAIHQLGVGGWAAAREFTTIVEAPSQGELVFPADQAVLGADTVVCIWSAGTPSIERYWLDLAVDSLFVSGVADSTITDTMATVYGLLPGLTYWWRVRASNAAGWGPYSAARKFAVAVTTVEDGGMPSEFALEQNYPNPFNPSTTIRYSLPLRTRVTLVVFNSLGQQVALLRGEEQEAGYHEAVFDASGLSSGVYFYRLTAGAAVLTRKMLIVR